MTPTGPVRYSTPQGRGVLFAAILGSSMALLDGTIVNVALRVLGDDLGASLGQLQWITNGYLLALSALILVGGSLGDLRGRRRVFEIGVVAFTVASLGCGLAPNAELLIAARVVQGVGAALLTPGSLALIQATFVPGDRGRAIGAWSGLGGIATAIGPFAGGALIEYASWRWAFLLNVPLALITLAACRRWVPESRNPDGRRLDLPGAVLACVALAGVTWALIEPWSRFALPAIVAAAVSAVAFVVWERRAPTPMVPLGLFRSIHFSGANAMTLVVYAALGAVLFFISLQLQTVLGYRPLATGVATLPITVAMLLLAARFGELGSRIGPRLPMTIGPLVMAVATLMLTGVGEGTRYVTGVLPGLALFGLGLAVLVAPLTATVLAAVPDAFAGTASGINNAVARAGSLLAVAALPALVGLGGDDYTDPAAMTSGYHDALMWCSGLLAAGGVISWLMIRGGRGAGGADPAGPQVDTLGDP